MSPKPMADLLQSRPVVFDYGSAHEFFRDLSSHYRATSRFSIRQRLQLVPNCSPALVSQVLAGNRRLTRDQLPAFSKLFKLNNFEFEYLDKNLREDLWNLNLQKDPGNEVRTKRSPQNHILNSWLNLYVKDLVHLKGFSLDVKILSRMLMGIAPPHAIERSVSYLLLQGFWRRSTKNTIVPENPALISTNEVPTEKIRDFHKRALKLALRGLDLFPTNRRKASTVLISIDQDKIPELRSMIDSFQNQLLKFIEDNPEGSDELLQVAIHLTPVGGKNE